MLAFAQVAAATPALEAAEEVSVRGKRAETGATTIGAAEAREIPGAFGDPMRSVEALPGVTPVVSGLPFFYVRGAPPNNTAFFIDGIRVPLLFHIGLAESVIHPGLIDRVDFQPGASSAEDGGYAGAIVSGSLKAPRPELHGEANLRLVDAGGLVESPFAEGRGSVLVAARYGYPGPIASAFVDNLKLDYWDYQLRANYSLTDRDRVGVFAFGSHDLFERTHDDGEHASGIDSNEHRVDLRWDHALDGGNVRVAGTLGYDRIGDSPTYLRDESFGVRAEIDKRLTPDVRVRVGARFGDDDYRLDTTVPVAEREFPAYARTNLTSTLHGDVIWRLGRVEIVPGVRFDTFSGIPALDPRLATRVTLNERATLVSTAGLAHQYQALRVGTEDLPIQLVTEPGFVPGEKKKLQEVAQLSQGVELSLPGEVKVTTTGFLSGWTNLTDVTSPCRDLSSPEQGAAFLCPLSTSVHGRAFGVETMVRRPLTRQLSGWLSATLSRSTREQHFLRADGQIDTVEAPSEGDRLLVVNALGTYDLGRRWRLGGRFVFYTGTPYSGSDGERAIPPYNEHRLAPFYRVDVRVEKRWPLGKSGSIAFVAEVQNLTFHKEPYGVQCGPSSPPRPDAPPPTTTCTPDNFGPLTLPSVGVEAFF